MSDTTPHPLRRYAQVFRLWTRLLERVSDEEVPTAEEFVGRIIEYYQANYVEGQQEGFADGFRQGTERAADRIRTLEQENAALTAQITALVNGIDETQPAPLTH